MTVLGDRAARNIPMYPWLKSFVTDTAPQEDNKFSLEVNP
jgi:hypothetical protein